MKKVIFSSLILFSLIFNAKSQFAVAGYHGSIYVDIVPDTIIQSSPGGGSKIYFIDLNQDGIKDIEFETSFQVSPAYVLESGAVHSQNTNTFFFQGGYRDSTSCINQGSSSTYTWTVFTSDVVKIYNYGDTITGIGTYTTGTLGYYFDMSPPTGASSSTNYREWANVDDKYMGVQYKTSTDTLYGWIKIAAGGAYCKLEEFSLGAPFVGLKENTRCEKMIEVFPNPADQALNIKINSQDKTFEIDMKDVFGNEAKPLLFSTCKTAIDISDLHAGIYFITIKTLEGSSTRKIIVQH